MIRRACEVCQAELDKRRCVNGRCAACHDAHCVEIPGTVVHSRGHPRYTAVTEARLLDLLAAACRQGAGAVWFGIMNDHERLAFDLFLVRTGDELGERAGPAHERFAERVRRMVEAQA